MGENGKTFGSVGPIEISDALTKLGYQIDRNKIELSQPIKTAGRYQVAVKLYKGVTGKLNVVVVKK